MKPHPGICPRHRECPYCMDKRVNSLAKTFLAMYLRFRKQA